MRIYENLWEPMRIYELSSGWCGFKVFQTCFTFHFIHGIMFPIDFHILQDGYCTTNQSFWSALKCWRIAGRRDRIHPPTIHQPVKIDIESSPASTKGWSASCWWQGDGSLEVPVVLDFGTGEWPGWDGYPAWSTLPKTMERSTIFHGKTQLFRLAHFQ